MGAFTGIAGTSINLYGIPVHEKLIVPSDGKMEREVGEGNGRMEREDGWRGRWRGWVVREMGGEGDGWRGRVEREMGGEGGWRGRVEGEMGGEGGWRGRWVERAGGEGDG